MQAMISIAHAVTGAFIASYLPHQPELYLPLAFASHFALDYLTHYDIGVAMKAGKWHKLKILVWESLDLLGAMILVACIWQQWPVLACRDLQCWQQTLNWPIWWGALAAIIPDFIEATDYFLERPLKFLQPFYNFHQRYHHSTKNAFWGLLPQAILVLALWGFVSFN
jgi:hypothetical protein